MVRIRRAARMSRFEVRTRLFDLNKAFCPEEEDEEEEVQVQAAAPLPPRREAGIGAGVSELSKVIIITGEKLVKQEAGGSSSSVSSPSCVVARGSGEEAGGVKLPVGAAAAPDDPKQKGIATAVNKQQQEGVQVDPHQVPKVIIITGEELVKQHGGGSSSSSPCVVARGGGEAGGGKLPVGAPDDDPKQKEITTAVNKQQQQQQQQQLIIMPMVEMGKQQEGVQADPHQVPKLIGGVQQRRLKCAARCGGVRGGKNMVGGDRPDLKKLKAVPLVRDGKEKEKMVVVVLDEDLEMVVTPAEYANWQEKQEKKRRQQEENEEHEKKGRKGEMVAMRFPPWYYT